MKIGIIGQGASGTVLALMLKQIDKNIDVVMFDHNPESNKKLKATGNGRCNLGNLQVNKNTFNSDFARSLINDFNINRQNEFFDDLGLLTRTIDNYVYPYSYDSNQVVYYISKLLKEYKIKLVNGGEFEEYEADEKEVKVIYAKKIYKFDRLVIATGGMSTPSLGSDGSVFKILKAHNYEITDLRPGLTPVVVKENVRGIENERVKGKVSLFINNKLMYEELGEVLFKKNGLSGICIFNASSIIARNKTSGKIKIKIDLFPETSEERLNLIFTKYTGLAGFSFLEGIFKIKIADYIRKNSGAKNLYKFDTRDIKNIVKYCKNMEFSYESSYDFASSQVTVGGVSLNNINEKMCSNLEKNVYFSGEILDIDGLCGGYNLMLAFASAHRVASSILD